MGVAVSGCPEQNVPETRLVSASVNRIYWELTTVTIGKTLASYVKVSQKSLGVSQKVE